MNSKRRWRRSLRLKFAPVGSRRDRWLRERMRSWNKLQQTSWHTLILRLLPPFIAQPIRRIVRQRRVEAAQPYRLQLDMILDQHLTARQVIIFPPSLDWNVQLFQRPQQLALALAEQGALVFYLSLKIKSDLDPFQQVSPRLYLCNVPIETFALMDSPLVYLLTWNRAFAGSFQQPRIIYDYVDDIQVFDGNYNQMVQDHHRLVQESYLVLTTADPLYQVTKKLRPDTLLCPNGVDYAHFESAREKKNLLPPEDLKPLLERGNPIVGYYGALAEWFDYQLVLELARLRMDLSFLVIGPDYDGTMHPDFLDLPNLAWLGVKPYRQLPAYLAYFDIAMIPFQLNEITHATSPLKLFEYMAASKPVIVTPMHESMRYDGVLIADTAEAFSEKIDQALVLRSDDDYLQRIDRTARQSTWQARAEQILLALGQIE